jgi:hypothetical protein
MINELGDGWIEEGYVGSMAAVARGLDKIFNGDDKGEARKVGFVLMVFPYGEEEGRVNYISNGADRADVVAMMREQIRRIEGGAPDVTGTA